MQTITIRKPESHEFERWAEIYNEYLAFYQTSLSEKALKKVWSWLFGPTPLLYCYLAEHLGNIIGLAHFRVFVRPIKGSAGIFLDDLIVSPKFRGNRVGYQLIQAVNNYAKEHHLSVVRWITAHDNFQAMKLYDEVAHKTSWIIYDLSVDETD